MVTSIAYASVNLDDFKRRDEFKRRVATLFKSKQYEEALAILKENNIPDISYFKKKLPQDINQVLNILAGFHACIEANIWIALKKFDNSNKKQAVINLNRAKIIGDLFVKLYKSQNNIPLNVQGYFGRIFSDIYVCLDLHLSKNIENVALDSILTKQIEVLGLNITIGQKLKATLREDDPSYADMLKKYEEKLLEDKVNLLSAMQSFIGNY